MKVDFARLDRAFNPRCVVVVGDSKQGEFHLLRSLSEFKGRLYSVQINPETIREIEALGIKNYTSLLDVPEPVDLVIVAVPRKVTPKILGDCIRKDVGVALIFTAGFAETNTEEGIRLERQLVEMAEEASLHVIGPNCRGIFNPAIGLKQLEGQYSGVSGPVGLISQSGGHALSFAFEAHLEGVDISKSVSFGNGVVLDSPDYLEYFGGDHEVETIAMYLEGVKDGRKFLRVLKEVAARKPVVIWRGGWTEAGGRAIASHTASLAVPQAVWEAVIKQSGAIMVEGMEELVDTLKALFHLPPVRGERVAVVGGAGGDSVAITDILSRFGLKVPLLTQKSYDELDTFFSLVGGSYRNPVDTDIGRNRPQLERIMQILAQDENIDSILLLSRVAHLFANELQRVDVAAAVNTRKKTAKPVLAVVRYSTPEHMAQAIEEKQLFQAGGVPVFPTMERGACALKNVVDYYRRRDSMESA